MEGKIDSSALRQRRLRRNIEDCTTPALSVGSVRVEFSRSWPFALSSLPPPTDIAVTSTEINGAVTSGATGFRDVVIALAG
jgi:hypothetical protein